MHRTQFWSWIRQHRLLSFVLLIALLVSMVYGLSWSFNLIRFGQPPPTGQSCGTIVHGPSRPAQNTRADATIQVLKCFWHAYQSCQAATMSQAGAGTDAGSIDTMTSEQRNNHCAIYGQENAWANTETRHTTFLCNQLSKEGDTLQLSHCDGVADFALTPRSITRFTIWNDESYLCGRVGGTPPNARPQQVESCFFTAYKQCLDDALMYNR